MPGIDLLRGRIIALNVSSDWLIGVPNTAKVPTEHPSGLSAVEMELVGSLRDQELDRLFRVVVRGLDLGSPNSTGASSANDAKESS